jgi:hypothetical protein
MRATVPFSCRVFGTALTLLALGQAQVSPVRLFWTDNDSGGNIPAIWVSKVDGGAQTALLRTELQSISGLDIHAVGVDPRSRTLYFAGETQIFSSSMDGTDFKTLRDQESFEDISALVVHLDEGTLYTSDLSGQKIQKVPLDLADPVEDVISFGVSPTDMELDDSVSPQRLYWVENDSVKYIQLHHVAGIGQPPIKTLLLSNTYSVKSLALDTANRHAYVTTDRDVLHIDLDGTSLTDADVTVIASLPTQSVFQDIEFNVADGKLYMIVVAGSGSASGKLYAVEALGSSAVSLVALTAVSGTYKPRGLVVYTPLPRVQTTSIHNRLSPAMLSAVEGSPVTAFSTFEVVLETPPSFDVDVQIRVDSRLEVVVHDGNVLLSLLPFPICQNLKCHIFCLLTSSFCIAVFRFPILMMQQ